MATKTISGLLVLPAYKLIVPTTVVDTLENLQTLVCGRVQPIYPGDFIPELEGLEGYINEEHLFINPEWGYKPWAIGPYDYVSGPCFMFDAGKQGYKADCQYTAEQVAPHIMWLW